MKLETQINRTTRGHGYILILLIIIFAIILPLSAYAVDPTAYILNTTGETLSKINLTDGTVSNNVVTIGSDVLSYPNQIVIRDTLAYVTASGTDEIQVINLNDDQTSYFISTGASSNAYWMDFADDRYLYVTLMLKDSLAKIDLTTKAKVSQTYIGKSPEGILIKGNKAYIACTGFDWDTYKYDSGKVTVYDIGRDSVIKQIPVGLNPQFLAADGRGRLHVVCTGDYGAIAGSIYIVDTDADIVVDSVLIGGTPGHITIGPDNVAYLAAAGWSQNGYIYSYNNITGDIYHSSGNPIQVDLNCMTVVSFQDTTIFAGSFTDFVNVIDSSGSNKARYAVGDGPSHIAFNYLPGDADGDFNVNLLDISYLVNWLYKGGPAPRWPKWRGNADGDNAYNILDISYLIGYLYKGGTRPKVGPGWI